MASIRKLVHLNRNLHRFMRRYISTTRSNPGNSKDSDIGDNKKVALRSSYDARKYSHNLPGSSVCPPFEALPYMPTGVFRCTDGEVIGPLAGKCAYYRNPEYYSFHHMSFYDMHMALLPCRKRRIKTGRKP